MIDVAAPPVAPTETPRHRGGRPPGPAPTPEPSPEEATPWSGSRAGRAAKAFLGWVPSALTFAALGGLAWFGHEHDWKLPTVAVAVELGPEWCEQHGVPEAECVLCTPGLIEDAPDLTFCKVHGVHDCVLDDPTLAEVPGLEEPEVTEADLDRAAQALALRPRRENLSLSKLPGTRVQFASVKAAQEAGVEVEPVFRRAVVESVAAPAEVRYDATRTAHVSPPADGVVRAVLVKPGEQVTAGQPLAVIDSEKVGRLKAELSSALSAERLARVERDRVAPLVSRNVVAGKRLAEADAALAAAGADVDRAARALGNLGLTVDAKALRTLPADEANAAVRRLGGGSDSLGGADGDNLVAVPAPLAGRVVELDAVVGEVVGRGMPLMTVSDTATVWADLRVPAEEAGFAELGRTVRYRPDGSDEVHEGEVVWVSSDMDPTTRTVRVRAELPNPDGALRNESFGTGELILREEPGAVVVPDEALMWDGENTLAFVRDARWFEKGRPKFFVARSVRSGVSADGFTEVIAGLLPGEVVATAGGDVLRAQLLKGNLGAGCTCGH